MLKTSHQNKNQQNYNEHAIQHNELSIKSTLYLAYRDVPDLLQTHLLSTNNKLTIRLLDYGCGSGYSTEIISQMLRNLGLDVEMYGIDKNEANLKLARARLPQAKFYHIDNYAKLEEFQFDLIICNFVLVENSQKEMLNILKHIQPLLTDNGVLLVTNVAKSTYNPKNSWYTLNNKFIENQKATCKFAEDQPVKLEVETYYGSKQTFSFFDFFHSGNAYRNAYQEAGLAVVTTHKPVGKKEDNMPWLNEYQHSPYKIHILKKNPIIYNPEHSQNNKLKC